MQERGIGVDHKRCIAGYRIMLQNSISAFVPSSIPRTIRGAVLSSKNYGSQHSSLTKPEPGSFKADSSCVSACNSEQQYRIQMMLISLMSDLVYC
jgi:hypothetical protein